MKYLKLIEENRTHVFSLFILILTSFLLHQYFVVSVYNWHITKYGNQISIIYVLSIVGGAFLLKQGKFQSSILGVMVLLYALFTGVIGSLVLVFYYVLSFYLLGAKYNKSGLAIQLSYGVIFFLLLKSILSIFSNNLVLNELIFIAAVAYIFFTTIRPKELLSNIFAINISSSSIRVGFVAISIVTVGLNMATLNYDSDSLWYPLRSNALYFSGDFFSDNGFYGLVHYYPKLWESLTNNLFVEYNFSYGLSLSSSLYIVLSAIVYSLFDKNKLINTLIVITTPVVIGLSFSLKTDLLLLVVFLVAFKAIEARRYDLVVSALLLSLCIKNSAALFVFPMLVYIYIKYKENVGLKDMVKINYTIIFLSVLVLMLFLFRTYELTGVLMAYPELLVKAQEMLGFDYRLPKRVSGNSHSNIFDIYKIVFFPAELAHHRFFYNGYLWIAALFVLDKFIALLFLLVLLVAYSVPNLGDGNYYAVLTVLLTVLFLRKVKIGWVGYVIVISNIAISIVANPIWAVPKAPSAKNICSTIICSDKNYLSKAASYHKVAELNSVINDKSMKYFVMSNDKNRVIWLLFHRYNVVHVHEFNVWNKLVPIYSLQEYLNKNIDVLVVENDYNYKVDLSGFEKFKVDKKYSYYSKICTSRLTKSVSD